MLRRETLLAMTHMSKTAKTILWVVVIAAVIYFGYQWYKKQQLKSALITPVGNINVPANVNTPLPA